MNIALTAEEAWALAQQYAAKWNIDPEVAMPFVEAGTDRPEMAANYGSTYSVLVQTPTGFTWQDHQFEAETEEVTDADRWEMEMESRWESRREYA